MTNSSVNSRFSARWAAWRHSDIAPGVGLIIFTILAMLVANSPLSSAYALLIETPMAVAVGAAEINKPLLLWINDGLMALFFLLVGIELKHELQSGHLQNRDQLVLPTAAAIGGMVVPAIAYLAITAGDPVAANGWAIPAATDIAFALALFAMLAKGLPPEIKILLLAIAIIDDIGAILIIALLYTADLSIAALIVAGIATAVLIVMARSRVHQGMPYLLVGLVLWVATLKSGVHATLAGVIVGLILPQRVSQDQTALGHQVEHALKPWVLFGVLPIFAFANAGIDFRETTLQSFAQPVVLGVIVGLALGKPLGVIGGVWLATSLKLARRPASLTWRRLCGVGSLCGVGFTMSLFIGSLAFEHSRDMQLADERLGIVFGSIISAMFAAAFFLAERGKIPPSPRVINAGDSA